MAQSEQEILGRYTGSKDPEAFRMLVERHSGMVFAACHRVLGNAAEAEDAAQTCFLQLVVHAPCIKGSVAAWLHRTAVNISIDRLRSEKARQARERKAVYAPQSAPTWDEVKAAVDEAIAELPDGFRIPIVMHYLEGRNQAEIGEVLGMGQAGVSRRLSRGVEKLRKRLRKMGWPVSVALITLWLSQNSAEAAPPALTTDLGKIALAGEAADPGAITHVSASGSVGPRANRIGEWLLRRVPFIAICAVFLTICAILGNWGGVVYSPAAPTFSDSTDKLQQTAIVPTLDTAIPQGKNIIWCSSFQIAWNKLKNDIIKEPIKLTNAQPIADRLNDSKVSEADMPTGCFYSAAGWVSDGIVRTIQQDMAKLFPDVPKPTLDVLPDGLVGYAYLAANVKFTKPFFDNDRKLVFSGQPVKSFGFRSKDSDRYMALRKQVAVLYKHIEDDGSNPVEFAIDPCSDSEPNQIVLACVGRKATLADTLAYVEQKVSAKTPNPEENPMHFGPSDTLLIPTLSWRIEHRFRELEGRDKRLQNAVGKGLWLAEAFQMIDFRLDRSGAYLKSEAKIIYQALMTNYIFDRPFLIYMKKRGAQHPFFVMWVGNPELLTKW